MVNAKQLLRALILQPLQFKSLTLRPAPRRKGKIYWKTFFE